MEFSEAHGFTGLSILDSNNDHIVKDTTDPSEGIRWYDVAEAQWHEAKEIPPGHSIIGLKAYGEAATGKIMRIAFTYWEII